MSNATAPRDAGVRHGGVIAIVVAAGLIGYEAAVHWAVVAGQGTVLGLLPAIGPAVAGVLWIVLRTRRIGLLVAAMVALGLLAVFVVRHRSAQLGFLYPVPSVAIFVLLMWVFGRTLLPGRVPLVTRLARHVHGSLPPELDDYTRQVTWAWCAFFATMATTSLLLFAFAPLATWSLFANVLTLPLIALMFVAEYAYRLTRYRDFAHAPITAAIYAFRDRGRRAASSGRG